MAALNYNISNVACEMVADAIMFLHIVHEAPRQSGVFLFSQLQSHSCPFAQYAAVFSNLLCPPARATVANFAILRL